MRQTSRQVDIPLSGVCPLSFQVERKKKLAVHAFSFHRRLKNKDRSFARSRAVRENIKKVDRLLFLPRVTRIMHTRGDWWCAGRAVESRREEY